MYNNNWLKKHGGLNAMAGRKERRMRLGVIFKTLGFLFLAFILFVAGLFIYRIRDRNRGYELDLALYDHQARSLWAGVAKQKITPELVDIWYDADQNARFEPEKGDTIIDRNDNNRFDAFWLAGFHQARPASGVHDDLWARTVVVSDGVHSVAMVTIDAIGYFHNYVVDVRKELIEQRIPVDHVIISATHNHEVPDLMGLWGETWFKSGINREYLKFVETRILDSIKEAVLSLQPVRIEAAVIESRDTDLVRDSRPPVIMDDDIRLLRLVAAENDSLLGVMMNYGNHPETLSSKNTLVTADFCHYWIKGIEEGITYDGEMKRPGVGGMALFFNGAVGGLMTTLGLEVHDPWLNRSFDEASFEKARAQGYRLAALVLDQMENGPWQPVGEQSIRLRAKTILLPVQNTHFLLAGGLGLFDRGFIGWKNVRSEVNVLQMGHVWILTVPGEINPEIVNGGIQVPEGADYDGPPVEVPALRDQIDSPFVFVFGLANDEIGYIMPKTHWDENEPFTYDYTRAPYGEINSLGPDTGPLIHKHLSELIRELQTKE
jgi:hypothetical protein